MKIFSDVFILFSSFLTLYPLVNSFDDVTSQVFNSNVRSGIIAAFGDLNADKEVDLFLIGDSGKSLKIILGNNAAPYYEKFDYSCSPKLPDSSKIVSVIPSDFDGDTFLDTLVLIKDQSNSNFKVKIFWGNLKKFRCDQDDHNFELKGQPLALDYNGDSVVDLMGEDTNGMLSFWTFKNRTVKKSKFEGLQKQNVIRYPHSNAFVDLNGDNVADIFITSNQKFEYWINLGGKYKLEKSIEPPSVSKHFQVTFCDVDANGVFEAIVPVCLSNECEDSAIFGLKNDKWENIGTNFVHNDRKWKFMAPNDGDELLKSMQQPTLRIADLNMDGFPDIMSIMYSTDKSAESVVLVFMNVPSKDNSFSRKFEIAYSINIQNASLATFHDIYDNGRMDLIINTISSNVLKLHAFQNTMYYDAYFLKVIVLSGQCSDYCPRDTMSYGTNTPGASVQITTITSESLRHYGCRSLFPKSAYFSLQLPYMIFGLGQMSNFVETLKIGLPNKNNKTLLENEWSQIIPNSKVVIIPYPLDSPSSWYMKLFVTTSRLVFITSGALVGTCLFIVCIILILHWREKKEDRKEKQQDAHRFHFNAM